MLELLAEDCTGIAATWCPNHGDCTCDGVEGIGDDRSYCPLHSHDSDHAEEPDQLERLTSELADWRALAKRAVLAHHNQVHDGGAMGYADRPNLGPFAECSTDLCTKARAIGMEVD